ncbi:hypothetical protein FRX31_007650 [Thalictrum thalictroides]|uniref:RNase H type-1 domain-containing protein n=1 Tax=Thalictrum thalictroides TaxID=46969 RepID=A0A7J6WZ78_THATH|nr:hypothetical protein FRX31_007650 [Thalictrum thalictroides]
MMMKKFWLLVIKKIRAKSILEAELLGVEGALTLAGVKGFRKIHLEGDYQTVMNALKKNDQHPYLSWQDAAIFSNILVNFSWISRPCNIKAHEVCQMGSCPNGHGSLS